MAKTRSDMSQVAGGKLRQERFFTRPEIDPFDEIEWDIRDALIGTPEKIAFEQKNIEFPKTWSQNATNIVAQKYFRGPLDTPQRETSVKQMIGRVVDWYTKKGLSDGYFSDSETTKSFENELKFLLVNQFMAFNSPVWFNVGLVEPPRCSACFILDVEDDMQSILNWYVEEGMIFKAGSGSGINLSKLRSSKEQLSSGGQASGPVSFMRGADASAGTIKSGGSTRRAAKMVVLDVDHPDVEEFIWCKVREEQKARALREAGFDMDLDGVDSNSLQYQNANNSVGFTDEFISEYQKDGDWELKAVKDGRTVKTLKARDLMHQIAQAAWECADPGVFYLDTMNKWHTSPAEGPIRATNPCGEFVRPANTSCNLASLRLTKFLDAQDNFDVDAFVSAVETTLTAMDVSVTNAEYPTDKIRDMVSQYRELGLGYTDLGALLMDNGIPYDSDKGRAWAAALTALMGGVAYRRSAEIAAAVGPYPGWNKEGNAEAHLSVIRQHIDALSGIDEDLVPTDILEIARRAWSEALELGQIHGYRNAQVTLIAPTGCLVSGSLVATSHGLVRLGSLGDPQSTQWQNVDFDVQTDEGPRRATKFFVNGLESVVTARTKRGYEIKGTPRHRIKVLSEAGEVVWRHFSDLRPGDLVPLALDQLLGEPVEVQLPRLGEFHWAKERHLRAPETMTPELAEFVGYFMGDGSLHARGIRLCVDNQDFEVIEHLTRTGKSLFGLEAHVAERKGYTEVAFHSVRLVDWWYASGFAKKAPSETHFGKGWTPHIPDAVLHSNDREVYRAFLRGLYEADGTVTVGYPHWMTSSAEFALDVQTLLLAIGYPTTRKLDHPEFGNRQIISLRLINQSYNGQWKEEIGFLSDRKNAKVSSHTNQQAARADRVPVTRQLIDRLTTPKSPLRRALLLEHGRNGSISRRLARALFDEAPDQELQYRLSFFYDSIEIAELTGEEMTYDLSVPDNVTYIANGFVSHNTISFLMDADTTGIEPDLALVKMKKLVGGGTMKIVNQRVPSALKRLGYAPEEISEIVSFISEHNNVEVAPYLKKEHYAVFDCAIGERVIHYMGHVKMMAAVQPLLSGAISKTINMPENATVEDIEKLYVDSWAMGLKNLAIYRDNCKVAQPLSAENKKSDAAKVADQVQPQRKHLPNRRPAQTIGFRVAESEGYIHAGEYPDSGELGEIFLKVAKQGSTLSGVMDAFAISISIGLQYGVPLKAYVKKFINMRFEPSGITDDPDFRFATSMVDYIFRRLAADYLTQDEKDSLNIKTTEERQTILDGAPLKTNGHGETGNGHVEAELIKMSKEAEPVNRDAPLCYTCGISMQPAGSCFVCNSCGTTSGCS